LLTCSWAAYFPDDPRCNRDDIEERIKAHEFGVIIYHTRTERKEQPHWDLVEKYYGKSEILFFDGMDTPLSVGPQQHKLSEAEYYGARGQLFVRELQDGCPEDPRTRPGANYLDGTGGGWVLKQNVLDTRDIQGLPMYYAPLKDL
jgi:hypothetical protein